MPSNPPVPPPPPPVLMDEVASLSLVNDYLRASLTLESSRADSASSAKKKLMDRLARRKTVNSKAKAKEASALEDYANGSTRLLQCGDYEGALNVLTSAFKLIEAKYCKSVVKGSGSGNSDDASKSAAPIDFGLDKPFVEVVFDNYSTYRTWRTEKDKATEEKYKEKYDKDHDEHFVKLESLNPFMAAMMPLIASFGGLEDALQVLPKRGSERMRSMAEIYAGRQAVPLTFNGERRARARAMNCREQKLKGRDKELQKCVRTCKVSHISRVKIVQWLKNVASKVVMRKHLTHIVHRSLVRAKSPCIFHLQPTS